jgi:hypothetical protein
VRVSCPVTQDPTLPKNEKDQNGTWLPESQIHLALDTHLCTEI